PFGGFDGRGLQGRAPVHRHQSSHPLPARARRADSLSEMPRRAGVLREAWARILILNMDRAALPDLLEAEGVSRDAYRLDARMEHDALTLERTGNGWCVYYSERGQRGSEWRFATEDEACRFLADALLADGLNRFQCVAIGVPSEADA